MTSSESTKLDSAEQLIAFVRDAVKGVQSEFGGTMLEHEMDLWVDLLTAALDDLQLRHENLLEYLEQDYKRARYEKSRLCERENIGHQRARNMTATETYWFLEGCEMAAADIRFDVEDGLAIPEEIKCKTCLDTADLLGCEICGNND